MSLPSDDEHSSPSSVKFSEETVLQSVFSTVGLPRKWRENPSASQTARRGFGNHWRVNDCLISAAWTDGCGVRDNVCGACATSRFPYRFIAPYRVNFTDKLFPATHLDTIFIPFCPSTERRFSARFTYFTYLRPFVRVALLFLFLVFFVVFFYFARVSTYFRVFIISVVNFLLVILVFFRRLSLPFHYYYYYYSIYLIFTRTLVLCFFFFSFFFNFSRDLRVQYQFLF